MTAPFFLTAAVDVADDRLTVVVRPWGVSEHEVCAHCQRPMADGGAPLPGDRTSEETDRVCATCWKGYLEFCAEIDEDEDVCEDCGGDEFDGDGMCLTVGCPSKDLFLPRTR